MFTSGGSQSGKLVSFVSNGMMADNFTLLSGVTPPRLVA